MSNNKQRAVPPTISLVSGAVAGTVEAAITYPFEYAKTRSQLGSDVIRTTGVPTLKSPIGIVTQAVRQNGIFSIYTGCSTLIFGTAFKAGVRFLTFDATKNLLADSTGKLSPARGILAGMMAGAVESLIAVTPTERIKTALIDDARSSSRRYTGSFHALRSIISERGITGVYRGLVSTTIKQSATSAVRMGSYNFLQQVVLSRKSIQNPKSPAITFTIGAVAGVITVYATQPFDTIKTRAQAAKGATTMEAFRAVLKDGGLPGFWSGSSMRLGRLVLSGGIVFTVYENVSSLLMGVANHHEVSPGPMSRTP